MEFEIYSSVLQRAGTWIYNTRVRFSKHSRRVLFCFKACSRSEVPQLKTEFYCSVQWQKVVLFELEFTPSVVDPGARRFPQDSHLFSLKSECTRVTECPTMPASNSHTSPSSSQKFRKIPSKQKQNCWNSGDLHVSLCCGNWFIHWSIRRYFPLKKWKMIWGKHLAAIFTKQIQSWQLFKKNKGTRTCYSVGNDFFLKINAPNDSFSGNQGDQCTNHRSEHESFTIL